MTPRFLFPAFLLGALAVAVPIALHLFRRDRAPEVPFTAVKLLRPQPLPRSRRRRLRDRLLLAARVAGLLLLAAAFARPYAAGPAGDTALAIVALDTSYSMGAPGRFARAVAMARDEIDLVPADHRIAVLAFDDGAVVAAEPGSADAARSALDALAAGAGGTAYGPLLARARELAAGGGATVTIIGDLQRRGWEGAARESLPANLEVRIRDVGPPPPNAAVSSVRVLGGRVVATIRSSHADAFTTSAKLRVHDRVVSETLITADAAAPVDVTFPRAVAGDAVLAVEIADPAGLPADDVRYLVHRVDAAPVLVLGADPGEEPTYVTRALDAADIPHRVLRGTARADGSGVPDDALHGARAVVLLSTRGLDRAVRARLDRFVRDGGGLLVSASSQTDAAVLAATLGWDGFSAEPAPAASARLAATDARHPIFRAFGGLSANLGAVRFTHRWTIPRLASPVAGSGNRGDAPSGGGLEDGGDGEGGAEDATPVTWDVIARFTDGPAALLERPHGAGRVLLFASDLERGWNDFPLHGAYVPFVVEAVRHAGAFDAAPAGYVLPRTPPGVPAQPGVYTLEGTGQRVAVNVDPRESSPARVTREEFLGMLTTSPADAGEGSTPAPAAALESRQSYWRYGILLLIGVLVAESILARLP